MASIVRGLLGGEHLWSLATALSDTHKVPTIRALFIRQIVSRPGQDIAKITKTDVCRRCRRWGA